MQTFYEWLSCLDILARLRLVESYFSFDTEAYNRLFNDELAKVLQRVVDPRQREALERMRNFNWVAYISAAIRHAGFHDAREIQERAHDIVASLLTGKLFAGFDQRVSGPMDLRFKRSVANAVKNLAERERNRRRLLPSVPISQAFEPGSVAADELPGRQTPARGEDVIDRFRDLVRARLGKLGLAVFDARLAGEETKSLVGRTDLGNPGRFVIKRVVQQIKALAHEYAERLGNPAFLRDIERAMGRESATVQKRVGTTAARQSVQ
jgi:hypothetical protein